jgi:hypothetical protein
MKTLLIHGTHEPPGELRDIVARGSTEVAELSCGDVSRAGDADRIVEWTGRDVVVDDRRLRWPDDRDEIRMLFQTGG